MSDLNRSIKNLKGVGPKKLELLNRLGINTIEDLLYYFPKSYEDFSKISMLGDYFNDEKNLYKVKIVTPGLVSRVRGNMTILKCDITDGVTNGELVFFNQHFLKPQLYSGRVIYVSAKPKYNNGRIQLTSPKIIDEKEVNSGLLPVYGLTKGITNNELRKFTKSAIDLYVNELEEILPSEMTAEYGLAPIQYAVRNIHYPKDEKTYAISKRRLVFEELLVLQLALFKLKSGNDRYSKGIVFKENTLLNDFIESLPFKLTNAQNRALNEILMDMKSDAKMNRLLQGDVGSGKTIIAVLSMYFAVLNGYQCSMMAPTELLAKQHYISLSEYFKDTGLNVVSLVGSTPKKEKEHIYGELENGNIDIIIGTHALIQDGVNYSNLGLTITDEQHRFGVEQRNRLNAKGENPDNLVMTATPIPRTLALILYGDLDISIIDELPPNRKSIETFVVNTSYQARMDKFVIKQIDDGRQVYVVCPLIEENDMPLKSAEEIYNYYKNRFKDKTVKLLHGKMKTDDKNTTMEDFVSGKVDILVSTTVIEVGVNVPNANLMLIYNADRFGLSQLHQLRGRVGRGEYKSYCVLINDNRSEIAYKRMKVMESSDDGFYIAEKDLELRGPGEFFGTRQHGIPDLKIANLATDMEYLKEIQNISSEISKEIYEENNSKYDRLKLKVDALLSKCEEIGTN